MSNQFTFVPLDLSKKNKRDLVNAEDRLMIRSLAARNPWNRPSEGEVVTPGVRRRKPTGSNPGMRIPLRPAQPGRTPSYTKTSSSGSDSLEEEGESKSKKKKKEEEEKEVKSRSKSRSDPKPKPQSKPQAKPQSKSKSSSKSKSTSTRIKQEEEDDDEPSSSGSARQPEPSPVHSGITSPLESPWEEAPQALEEIRTGRIDPFWTYPIPYYDFMTPYLNHRIGVIVRKVPLLDHPDVGSDPTDWAMAKVFLQNRDSPAYLYANILFAGAHMEAGGSRQSIHAHYTQSRETLTAIANQDHMLWLRLSAIQAINEDLSDVDLFNKPKKFSATLAAISTLATYEYWFGDRELQRMHFRGCNRLIQLYGGFDRLDETSRRFWIWVMKLAVMGSENAGPGASEFRVVLEELRDVLGHVAEALGYDLDAVLGSEEEGDEEEEDDDDDDDDE